MRNVYLSFLGANPYLECHYCLADQPLSDEPTRFIQEATVRYCCTEWSASDRVFIFTTRKACRKNWMDNGHGDGKDGLDTRLNALGLNAKIIRTDIPDGHSETEIWQIFDVVFNTMQAGDRIVFDITHAFRSIPMLAIVVLNYAKILKDIRITGIYYGAFEQLGELQDVKRLPLEARKPPVLDLTALDQLLDWSFAVERFQGAGDAAAVSALANSAVAPVMRASRGQHPDASAIRQVAKALEAFTKTLSTCRGPEISTASAKLKQVLNHGADADLVKPFYPLFEKIRDQLLPFGYGAVKDGLQAARWCLNHNLIQQGYTILLETLISYVVTGCEREAVDIYARNVASQALRINSQSIPEKDWRTPAADDRDLTRRFIEFIRRQADLKKVYSTLNIYRNDINHAGYQPNPIRWENFEKNLQKLIDSAELIIAGVSTSDGSNRGKLRDSRQ